MRTPSLVADLSTIADDVKYTSYTKTLPPPPPSSQRPNGKASAVDKGSTLFKTLGPTQEENFYAATDIVKVS